MGDIDETFHAYSFFEASYNIFGTYKNRLTHVSHLVFHIINIPISPPLVYAHSEKLEFAIADHILLSEVVESVTVYR